MSTLDEYQKKMTDSAIVGGPYNAPYALVQRGKAPKIGIVPFIDGVQINSDDATNHYDPDLTVWDGNVQASGNLHTIEGSGSMNTSEYYLQLKEPVDRIRFVAIPIENIVFSIANSNTRSRANYWTKHQASLVITLIKTDLSLGEPFGLDALNGPNSQWHMNSEPHGTLYQTPPDTPDKFDNLEGYGHPLWEQEAATDFGPTFGGSNAVCTGGGSSSMVSTSGDISTYFTVNFRAEVTDGPYYGVHLFWRSQQRDPTGDDELFYWNDTCDWSFSCTVPNQRQAARPGFVMTNDFINLG